MSRSPGGTGERGAPGSTPRLWRLLSPGKHLPLLLALVALFLLYPAMVEGSRLRLFRFGFAGVLVLSVYSLGRRRRQLWTAALLGLPAVAGQLVAYAVPDSGLLPMVAASLGLLFLAYTTVVVSRSVLAVGPVTGDKIAGAVSVYLLLGLIWAFLYGLLAMAAPASFRWPDDLAGEPGHGQGESAFIYFSFATLSTLGYGDISPASHWSQTFAWMEAVTGQLFLAILIARLVGLQVAVGAAEEKP